MRNVSLITGSAMVQLIVKINQTSHNHVPQESAEMVSSSAKMKTALWLLQFVMEETIVGTVAMRQTVIMLARKTNSNVKSQEDVFLVPGNVTGMPTAWMVLTNLTRSVATGNVTRKQNFLAVMESVFLSFGSDESDEECHNR